MSWNLIPCLWLLGIWFIFVLSLAQKLIPKNTRELGVGREQFHSCVNGLIYLFLMGVKDLKQT